MFHMANAIVSVLVIAIVLLSAYMLYLLSANWSPLLAPAQRQNSVVVSGTITTGVLTRPTLAAFTSKSTGARFVTSINGGGHYAISLLGNDTYAVKVYYSSLFGNTTSPACGSRTVALNGSSLSANFTMSC